MKVVLVNKFLYPRGGDAICTLATGQLLKEKGHEVAFWGMDHPDNPPYPNEDLFVANMDYEDGKGLRTQFRAMRNVLYSFESKRKFRDMLERIKPDVVHLNNFAHQISPSILSVIRTFGIPSVMTMHDYKLVCPAYALISHGSPCERCRGGAYYHCLLGKCTKGSYPKSLVNTIEMYLHHSLLNIYGTIDVLISPSRFMKEKIIAMGFNKNSVHIPNYIDIASDDPSKFVQAEERYVLYFGRLSEEKGIGNLIDAFDGTDIPLRIVGSGPLREALEKRVKKTNRQNIQFRGFKTGEDLKKEIFSSYFTIVPSLCYENNPRAILESFASGKPVVGSRIGGIPELVIDGYTGVTFTPGNVAEMRQKVTALYADAEKVVKLGANAKQFVEEQSNADRYYHSIMEAYQAAIDRHRRTS